MPFAICWAIQWIVEYLLQNVLEELEAKLVITRSRMAARVQATLRMARQHNWFHKQLESVVMIQSLLRKSE
jgi:ribosomal protein S25